MVGIDTNILLYAYDKGSPLHEEAKALIGSMLGEDGIAISDLSLLEFFSVATDGRKMTNPLLAEEALKVIESIWSAEEFLVCAGNAEVMRNAFRYAAELNILRYGINDVYIATSLAEKGIRRVLTRNTKDFKQFDFIEAINPFSQSTESIEQSAYSPSSIALLSAPCASRMIPYARQSIDEKDVASVCKVLRSEFLTTGPKVAEFEKAVADYVGAKHAVAVSSGTAALHAAMFALGIAPGDEVIVPPMTFAATANCILYQGGTPVFADVDPNTLLIDPPQVAAKITPKTKAIIGVDYAGQPCDWDALREIAKRHNLYLVDDGCHALGAEYKGKKVGSLADLTIFSFHPVKHITTGEGGMVVTDDEGYAERMRIFSTHGITRDPKYFSSLTSDLRPLTAESSWFYEMVDLGYNYRITDLQCALGISQLKMLPKFLQRRREIAARYDEALTAISGIKPLGLRTDVLSAKEPATLHAQCSGLSTHAYHLYVIRLNAIDRAKVFKALREHGVGVNVHYIPIHLHPYYRKRFGTGPGSYPIAEKVYEEIISLPMFPGMIDKDVEKVIEAVKKVMQ